jgi:hypothetical protein
MQRLGTVSFILAAALSASLAGCAGHAGSFDAEDNVTTKLGNLLAFNKTDAPAAPPKPGEHVECPEIVVLDGTAAQRVYAGGASNEGLRYQFSLGDVARECSVQGGQISLKVGIEGKVLLGPNGSPGNFTAPIRVAVVRESDQHPIISKLYHVSANIAAGQTQGGFALVSEPLVVPFTQEHAEVDYTIKVGFDEAGDKGDQQTRSRRGR